MTRDKGSSKQSTRSGFAVAFSRAPITDASVMPFWNLHPLDDKSVANIRYLRHLLAGADYLQRILSSA